MAKSTIGTDLFLIDPDTGAVLDVGCVTSIDGLDVPVEQLETTCLSDTVRTYIAGLATPGTLTFGINTDTEEPAHIRIHQIYKSRKVTKFAIGFNESTAQPTGTTNSNGDYDFVLPATRGWIVFEGFLSSFPFSFALNSVVTSSISVQLSGDYELIAVAGS